MSATITALFSQRRDVEMAIEQLVQEHGIDRNAIAVEAASDANTAGTELAGGDVETGHLKIDSDGEPVLRAKSRGLPMSVRRILLRQKKSFETYGDVKIPS